MSCNSNQFIWKEDFPLVYGHTSISFLKNCPGFFNAKNGDIEAALTTVSTCVKQTLTNEIRKKYPDAILLPVITKNKLPEALAIITGLKMHRTIQLCKTIDRKSLSAMERLLHTPTFCGNIKPGESYIIVDDIVTQGGTISALRKYILSHGGIVVAILALAYSINSQAISPSIQDISTLMIKFNKKLLSHVLKKYRIAEDLGELTNAQIKYLLRFERLNNITDKLERASITLNQKGYKVSIN